MVCSGCGNENAWRVKLTIEGETCNVCGSLGNLYVPDVSFTKPYFDPNLGHPNRPWEAEGVWIESKRHKAMLMKEQNLRERGDRRHGSRNEDRALQRSAKEQGFGVYKPGGNNAL